jgi:hypothetical protein
LSGANAYSKLYFKTKIKPVLQERWRNEYLAKHPEGLPATGKLPRWPIRLQNKVLHELWKEEPNKVKDEVWERFGLNRNDSDSEPDEDAGPNEDEAQRADRLRVACAQEYQK